MSAGKVSPDINLQDFKDTAKQWREKLLRLAVNSASETLGVMTGLGNINEKLMLGAYSYNAQFKPYKRDVTPGDSDLNIKYRELEVFFGQLVENFEPNSAIQTMYGKKAAAIGDGMKNAPIMAYVLAGIADSASEHLDEAIFAAVRNPNGTRTVDLFDGFDTITSKEVTAGNMSKAIGNYEKLDTVITSQNCCDVLRKIARGLNPLLRKQKCYVYCSQEIQDMYEDSYQYLHGNLQYNKEFEKTVVEGSNGRLILCPLASKAGSRFIHITPRSNMCYGYRIKGEDQRVNVEKYSTNVLTLEMDTFFGVQFETIDPRVLKVIELADETRTVSLSCTADDGTVKIGSGEAGATATTTVTAGSKVTITATAAEGKVFVKWSDNNTNATREITVTDNVTLTATFEAATTD